MTGISAFGALVAAILTVLIFGGLWAAVRRLARERSRPPLAEYEIGDRRTADAMDIRPHDRSR